MRLEEERFPYLITREDWRALEAQSFIESLDSPAEHVFLTYADAVDRCFSRAQCTKAMQDLQKFHMGKGAPDLPYNFLVGHDDNIYEGRGWFETVPGPPETPEFEGKSLVFAFIGPKRENYKMKKKDFKTAYSLIHYGLENSYIYDDGWTYRYVTEDWNSYKGFKVTI